MKSGPSTNPEEVADISCPACGKEGHWGEIRPHIHSTDDPEHNEVAENIDEILGEHPLTIN